MKKYCKKDNAVKYFYKLMDLSEEQKYKNHIKNCSQCRLYLKKITHFKKISDYRQKVRVTIPSFNQIPFPEKEDKPTLRTVINSLLLNKKVIRYAVTIPVIIIIIFCMNLLFKKADVTDIKIVTLQERKEKPERSSSIYSTTVKKDHINIYTKYSLNLCN